MKRKYILANSTQMTTENLREQVKKVAEADPRFQMADGSKRYIWVQDLIAPTLTGETWKAVIEMGNKSVSVDFTLSGETVTLGAELTEVVRRSHYVAIANDAGFTMTIGNADEIDEDGWALIAPFGEHKKTRTVKLKSGGYETQHFIQVLDNAAAEALVKAESGLFRKLRRALVGIPVYADATGVDPHPDLRHYSSETVTTGNAKPVPAGVIDQIRIGKAGIEAHFTLTPDGATAVANGAKKPSALWEVGLIETLANGTHRVAPFKLLSVGLTPYPNIDGVDSLANAKPGPAATETEETDQNMKHLIIGWLAAQGTVLANDASEKVVLEAIQTVYGNKGTEIITLGNARTAAEGKLTTLEGQLTEKTTALGNANDRITALEKDRTALIGPAVDLAIHQGKIELSQREGQITALGNAQDIPAALEAMEKLPVKFAIGNAKTDSKGKGGAGTSQTAREQIFHLANNDDRYRGLPWETAYERIKQDHPSLAEQLKQAPAVK